jgi:ribonuclease HII
MPLEVGTIPRTKSRLELPKQPTLDFELALWAQGVDWVAGLDEAGRGAWCGPVCAGAVTLPQDLAVLQRLSGVRDSKQMSVKARSVWAERIRSEAVGWGVGFASNEEIDAIGILPATRLAMERALAGCDIRPEHLLIDAVRLPGVATPQTSLVKGDVRVLSIAAASVLAKTARDAVMIELDGLYPGYGFARHKGYGTKIHQEALLRLGPCAVHRRSFAPLRRM